MLLLNSVLNQKSHLEESSMFLIGSPHVCSVDQSCLPLCDPVHWSPPGFSVHEIFKAKYWVGGHILLQGTLPTQGNTQTRVSSVSCIYSWIPTWEVPWRSPVEVNREQYLTCYLLPSFLPLIMHAKNPACILVRIPRGTQPTEHVFTSKDLLSKIGSYEYSLTSPKSTMWAGNLDIQENQ